VTPRPSNPPLHSTPLHYSHSSLIHPTAIAIFAHTWSSPSRPNHPNHPNQPRPLPPVNPTVNLRKSYSLRYGCPQLRTTAPTPLSTPLKFLHSSITVAQHQTRPPPSPPDLAVLRSALIVSPSVTPSRAKPPVFRTHSLDRPI
jgi:hypothetical protein